MASPLLPPSFWGLDGLIDSFPKFYIQDLLEMPEMESHTDQLKGGPIEDKLDMVLTEIENGSIGFSIGQLLHVRGALQTYNNIREIKAYHYAVVHCPSAETERMLHLPQLYQTVYDKPFVLPDRLAREVSSLPKGELDQKKLSHELQLQDEFMKLAVSALDEKESQMISERDLYESVKCSTQAVVNVIRYNRQLHRSVVEIISKHMEHQRGSSDPGCHFMHIYEELRKLLPFSQLNKPSLWKCLGLLEEQSDIISSTEKHFIVFS